MPVIEHPLPFALQEVLGLEGFVEVMASAMDTTSIDSQPELNASRYNSLFFVLSITIGTFFITELYAGVIIQSYTKSDGTAFMTEEQRQWADAKLQVCCKFTWRAGSVL